MNVKQQINSNRRSILALGLLGLGCTWSLYAQSRSATEPTDSEMVIVERCFKYIENAQWVYRDYQWVLSITPTACARRTLPDATPFLLDQLNRDYSNSRYWTNPHGMRHQVICHLAIARDKPEWNIEPWRPDVG